jgi:hypothetical protein
MDDLDYANAQPIYRTRLGRIGGSFVVGTYLVLAFLLALNGWILRKLWHSDGKLKSMDREADKHPTDRRNDA